MGLYIPGEDRESLQQSAITDDDDFDAGFSAAILLKPRQGYSKWPV